MVSVAGNLRRDGHQWRHKMHGSECFVGNVRPGFPVQVATGKGTWLVLIMIYLSIVANAASCGQVGLAFLVRSKGPAVGLQQTLWCSMEHLTLRREDKGETALGKSR